MSEQAKIVLLQEEIKDARIKQAAGFAMLIVFLGIASFASYIQFSEWYLFLIFAAFGFGFGIWGVYEQAKASAFLGNIAHGSLKCLSCGKELLPDAGLVFCPYCGKKLS